jgi:hypothetical protein
MAKKFKKKILDIQSAEKKYSNFLDFFCMIGFLLNIISFQAQKEDNEQLEVYREIGGDKLYDILQDFLKKKIDSRGLKF